MNALDMIKYGGAQSVLLWMKSNPNPQHCQWILAKVFSFVVVFGFVCFLMLLLLFYIFFMMRFGVLLKLLIYTNRH